jgi:GABA permease
VASKVIALVSEPASGDALRAAIGGRADDAEVLVVAPALNSKLRFWMSDPDPAIERAEAVEEETVERMVEEGVDAAGDTGESDPVLAIQDALQTFDADEIVLFTHPRGKRNWLEEGVVDEVKERFGLPVAHLVIEG